METGKRIEYRYFFLSFSVAFLLLSLLLFLLMSTGRPEKSTIGEIEPAAAGAEEYVPGRDEALSVLFVGVAENGEADAFLLARFDPARNAVPIVAFPVQTAVRNRDKTETLAEVYRYGGADYTRRALSETLGVDIDRYVRMDMPAFLIAASTVGSVEYNLPYQIVLEGEGGVSMTLSPGLQLLDGRKVAEIIRYGGYPGGELDRCAALAGVTAAIVDQRIDVALSVVVDKVFEKIVNLVDTDISYADYDDRKRAAEYLARRGEGIAVPIHVSGSYSPDGEAYTLSDTFVALLTQTFS